MYSMHHMISKEAGGSLGEEWKLGHGGAKDAYVQQDESDAGLAVAASGSAVGEAGLPFIRMGIMPPLGIQPCSIVAKRVGTIARASSGQVGAGCADGAGVCCRRSLIVGFHRW